MLRLTQIALTQFKNYETRSFNFTGKIVGICGANGVGKTNLLDAIHYLCFTRSYFTRTDANNILGGRDGFRLEGRFQTFDKPEAVVCILRASGKKEFSVDGRTYDRFSQHIGRYPCVMVAPDDIQMITGTSEARRIFLDTLLAQLSAEYLQWLIQYNKILQQRNALLKSFAEAGRYGSASSPADHALLDVLDKQLSTPGEAIFDRRKRFLVGFLPVVKQLYGAIAAPAEGPTPELVEFFYTSDLLQASMPELLASSRSRDLQTLRTTAGIHKDDLELNLNNQPFRQMASQGQRKSLLFALKLAELQVLGKEKGFAPVLLLDDVFEKLDEQRVNNLLQHVCVENDGQVFITDTHEARLHELLSPLDCGYQVIRL